MDWLNLILLLLLTAGHTELLVTMVNRLHSLPIRCATLRHIRHVHDVLIPTFPLVLFWVVGIRGPGLLTGGSWTQLSIAWMVYLGLCAAGTAGLAASVVRWLTHRVPDVQRSNDSQIVDIEKRLGYRPIGDGPFRFLTRVPGNEIFRIEVAEKVFHLPRLPTEWDGLSILHLTDLHFIGTVDRPFFERVAELGAGLNADLIVFTGDLLDKQQLVDWLPETLGRLRAPLGCYFILGNHDWFFDPAEIRGRFAELGWTDVAGKTVVISGRRIEDKTPNSIEGPSTNSNNSKEDVPLILGGTEQPWMGAHPDFDKSPSPAVRILLSHSPDNLPWAKQQNVDLMLAGHNHGGQVVPPIIGPVYSPSRYGVRYSSGAFWEPPTLMYVSRGISARHPLRWRCPPEITKLVLRPATDLTAG